MITCLRKIGILAAVAVAVIGITGCWYYTDGGGPLDKREPPKPATVVLTMIDTVSDPYGFVRVPGASIKGDETWTPSSHVFVRGRALEINSFYMSDHEVTRAEYKEVIGSDPSIADSYDKNGNKLMGDKVGNTPVNWVSWYDAIVYCNKLSIKESFTPCYKINGKTDPAGWGAIPNSDDATWNTATCDFTADGYRLPTEAEWEWAARGGTNHSYAGSDNIDDVAWYTSNTSDTGTREVKTKEKNGYELYDMSGNVWELCWDWYGLITSSTPSTGSASGAYRCLRGGSWYDSTGFAMVASQGINAPDSRSGCIGFRVVRNAN